MALRVINNDQCRRLGQSGSNFRCTAAPGGGNSCVSYGGAGGADGIVSCLECVKNCSNDADPGSDDPGHGNFGVMTFPWSGSEGAKCYQMDDSCVSTNENKCVKCDPNPTTDCGQMMINSGTSKCIPAAYADECCLNSVKSMRNEQYKYMVTGATSSDKQKMWCKYIGIGLAFLLVIFLIVCLMKRPKKSQFAVYWRR